MKFFITNFSRPSTLDWSTAYFNSFFVLLILSSSYSLLSQERIDLDPVALTQLIEQEVKDNYSYSLTLSINFKEIYSSQYIQRVGSQNQLDKSFNIASISKTFTAVSILLLCEKGLLRLDDTLEGIFKEIPGDKKNVSIHHLLSHQAGFDQSYPLEGIEDSQKALSKLFKSKLLFTPGSSFKYSNQNYQLLALIIEQLSGQSYERHLKDQIIRPLGLENTFFWSEFSEDKNLAKVPKKIFKKLGRRDWAWIGATGIFSNAHDLMIFWKSIYSNKLLSEKSKSALFSPHVETNSGLGIGYGVYHSQTTKWDGPEQWTRGTESWGHNAVIRHFPDNELTLIVTTNSGEYGNNKLTGNKIISTLVLDQFFDGK